MPKSQVQILSVSQPSQRPSTSTKTYRAHTQGPGTYRHYQKDTPKSSNVSKTHHSVIKTRQILTTTAPAPKCNNATTLNIPHNTFHPLSLLIPPPTITNRNPTSVTKSATSARLIKPPVVRHILLLPLAPITKHTNTHDKPTKTQPHHPHTSPPPERPHTHPRQRW